MTAIYVHIPFCQSKCAYCAFASFVEGDRKKYFDTLLIEIEKTPRQQVSSIYFGGGTPSFVETEFLTSVLKKIYDHFDVIKNTEVTIECNPCSTTREKLKSYRMAGFNRVSFGVQSLSQKSLSFLGRKHTSLQALDVIKMAQECGFDNISADLLLGLKDSDVVADAEKLIDVGVKHISAYMLQVEPKTPLADMYKKDSSVISTDDEAVEEYKKLNLFLEKKGFVRYEISNFALNGYASKHNMSYWTGQKYLGFGLAAHSFDGKNMRWQNASTFENYFEGKVLKEYLSPQERDEEIIMLGLRCDYGVDIKKLHFDIKKQKNFKIYSKMG